MIDPTKRLTRHFSLGEMIRSQVAERDPELLHAQLNPEDEPTIVTNLAYLCATTLQPTRDVFAFPIDVTSGYRSPALNDRIGGSKTSQHCLGQAADCVVSDHFLGAPSTARIRAKIEQRFEETTGRRIRGDVNANFYLFAYLALRRERLDIDQVIHEGGFGPGNPGWVHVSASTDPARDRKQILCIGSYQEPRTVSLTLVDALSLGIESTA